MNEEFLLPKTALVNKFIPKNKFYEKADFNSKQKDDFVNKIQKIRWLYKLAGSTINTPGTDKVTEIQIFEIELKNQIIPRNLLHIIDKNIPYQILYKFIYNDNFAYGLTDKVINRVENYYFSDWNKLLNFDFSGIDLEIVYNNLLRLFLPEVTLVKESIADAIRLDNDIRKITGEINVLEKRVSKVNQFNRKAAINKELLAKRDLLKNLKEGKTYL